jgi:hypothetical protein
MELVVDANILLAGFMKAAVTRELLLDNRLIQTVTTEIGDLIRYG